METSPEARPLPKASQTSPVPKPVVAFFAALRKIMGKPECDREVVHEPDAVAHRGAWELRVSVEPDLVDGGFIAECLDVPGAMSQGETEEEALENLVDAVQGVVAAKMEEQFRSFGHLRPGEAQGRVVSITF